MEKILVAMDNLDVLDYVKKLVKYIVHDRDISYKEGVIEYLSKNHIDYILTKDMLDGDMTKEIYIKQLRLIAPKAKIILFVEELDDQYKSFLFANEVFSIVEQKQITKELISDVIEEANNKVVYKILDTEKNKKYMANEATSKNDEQKLNFKIITKHTIAIFGTSGSGKSYISNIISNIIGNKLRLKTLLIDLDIQNGSADIYGNLNGESNGLSKIINEIDNNNFTSKTFQKYICNENNISYITNNSSIFECQNKFCEKYYKKILFQAKSDYDAVVVDTPNSVFLDATYFTLKNTDTVIFVVNPNYISIRQASKYLDLILNVWNIPREKIFLVVNRTKKEALSIIQIESLLEGLKVKLEIPENQNIENVLNGLNIIEVESLENLNNFYEIFGNNISQNKQNRRYGIGILSKLLEGIGTR